VLFKKRFTLNGRSLLTSQDKQRAVEVRHWQLEAARPGVAHLHSERSGRMLIFYTPDNVMSYGMARLKSDNLQDPGQTNADLRKRLGHGGAKFARRPLVFFAER